MGYTGSIAIVFFLISLFAPSQQLDMAVAECSESGEYIADLMSTCHFYLCAPGGIPNTFRRFRFQCAGGTRVPANFFSSKYAPHRNFKFTGCKVLDFSNNCDRKPGFTQFFSFDQPSRLRGDLERPGFLRRVKPRNPCRGKCIVSAHCRTVNGKKDSRDTGEFFRQECSARGLTCVNSDQEDDECEDYEVQYYCPFPAAFYRREERFRRKSCPAIVRELIAPMHNM